MKGNVTKRCQSFQVKEKRRLMQLASLLDDITSDTFSTRSSGSENVPSQTQ